MVDRQVEFLLAVRKTGKGEHFRVARQRIIDQLSTDMWRSYCGATMTYTAYKSCIQYMRKQLSWDNLLGVKQYSLYDLLDDEKLVETMTAES